MSLSYANTPVYIGHINTSSVNTGFTGSIDYIPATQADISFSSSLSPKRNLGVDVSSTDQFTVNNALSADITINSLIHPTLEQGFRYLSGTAAAQDAFVPIQIGNNLYKKCYPQNITVSVEPFAPVTISASFVSLDPPTGEQIVGDQRSSGQTAITPISGDRFAYGYTSSVTNAENVVGNVQSQISFTRNYNRTPVYGIGSPSPTSMLLDGIEEEMSITSTGLQSFINLSGDTLGSTIQVLIEDVDDSMDNLIKRLINMPIGSRVSTQGYSSQGGDSVSATATIKNIKL
tara:strand:+ start:53 stop:919 length:867 start_codon:yes stop_codon:yes gene_type:complete